MFAAIKSARASGKLSAEMTAVVEEVIRNVLSNTGNRWNQQTVADVKRQLEERLGAESATQVRQKIHENFNRIVVQAPIAASNSSEEVRLSHIVKVVDTVQNKNENITDLESVSTESGFSHATALERESCPKRINLLGPGVRHSNMTQSATADGANKRGCNVQNKGGDIFIKRPALRPSQSPPEPHTNIADKILIKQALSNVISVNASSTPNMRMSTAALAALSAGLQTHLTNLLKTTIHCRDTRTNVTTRSFMADSTHNDTNSSTGTKCRMLCGPNVHDILHREEQDARRVVNHANTALLEKVKQAQENESRKRKAAAEAKRHRKMELKSKPTRRIAVSFVDAYQGRNHKRTRKEPEVDESQQGDSWAALAQRAALEPTNSHTPKCDTAAVAAPQSVLTTEVTASDCGGRRTISVVRTDTVSAAVLLTNAPTAPPIGTVVKRKFVDTLTTKVVDTATIEEVDINRAIENVQRESLTGMFVASLRTNSV